MKISMEIECSAQEVREVLGMPDVTELQEKWMQQVEAQMQDELGKFSTDEIMKSWTAGASANFSAMQKLAEAFTAGMAKSGKPKQSD